MKQLLLLLVMIIFTANTFGQGHGSRTLALNEKGYKASQVLDSIYAKKLTPEWVDSLLAKVNRGLKNSGQDIRVDSTSLEWIFKNVTDSSLTAKDFTNSAEKNKKMVTFTDDYTGGFAFFKYKNCIVELYKTVCANMVWFKDSGDGHGHGMNDKCPNHHGNGCTCGDCDACQPKCSLGHGKGCQCPHTPCPVCKGPNKAGNGNSDGNYNNYTNNHNPNGSRIGSNIVYSWDVRTTSCPYGRPYYVVK